MALTALQERWYDFILEKLRYPKRPGNEFADSVISTLLQDSYGIAGSHEIFPASKYSIEPGTQVQARWTAAIAAVQAEGGGFIQLGAGTYTFSFNLSAMPTGVGIKGIGTLTILDFSGAPAGIGHIAYSGDMEEVDPGGGGEPVVIGDPVEKCTNTIELVPTVESDIAEGTLLHISDNATGQYNDTLTAYKKGEFLQVKGISGTTITTQTKMFFDYEEDSDTKINIVTATVALLQDFMIKGSIKASGSHTPTIGLYTAHNSIVRNVRFSNTNSSHILCDKCFDTEITGCWIYNTTDGSVVGSTNNGIIVQACQRMFISGNTVITTGVGVVIGNPADGLMGINLQIIVNDNVFGGYENAADNYGIVVKGNSEFINIFDNVGNGVKIGGNNITVARNTLTNDNYAAKAVASDELTGADIKVSQNELTAQKTVSDALVDIVIDDSAESAFGTVEITKNVVKTGCGTAVGKDLIKVKTTDDTVISNFEVKIEGNDVKGTPIDDDDMTGNVINAIRVYTAGNKGIKTVNIDNNSIKYAGIKITKNFEELSIKGNVINRDRGQAVKFEHTSSNMDYHNYHIEDNKIIRPLGGSGKFVIEMGDATDKMPDNMHALIEGNKILNPFSYAEYLIKIYGPTSPADADVKINGNVFQLESTAPKMYALDNLNFYSDYANELLGEVNQADNRSNIVFDIDASVEAKVYPNLYGADKRVFGGLKDDFTGKEVIVGDVFRNETLNDTDPVEQYVIGAGEVGDDADITDGSGAKAVNISVALLPFFGDHDVLFEAPIAMQIASVSEAGTGTITYTVSVGGGAFGAATFPLTMAAGDVLKATSTGWANNLSSTLRILQAG